MLKGLIHGHQGLAYLLVLSSSASLVMAVINLALGSRPGIVRLGTILGRKVEPMLMGLIGLLGLSSWVMSGLSIATPYLWGGVAAVVLQGAWVSRVTKPALIGLTEGDASHAGRWVVAALVHTVLVYGIFGWMLVS